MLRQSLVEIELGWIKKLVHCEEYIPVLIGVCFGVVRF